MGGRSSSGSPLPGGSPTSRSVSGGAAEGTAGPSYSSEVVVAHDGRRLWVANRGHDSIAVLGLDGTGEKAELIRERRPS